MSSEEIVEVYKFKEGTNSASVIALVNKMQRRKDKLRGEKSFGRLDPKREYLDAEGSSDEAERPSKIFYVKMLKAFHSRVSCTF